MLAKKRSSCREQSLYRSLFTALFLAFCLLIPASALAETMTLSGSFDYDAAYRLLELANAERLAAGLAPMSYDYGLEGLAMQRAAELAVLLSHNRPDGSTTSYYENFATGWPSAEAAHSSFMGSSSHSANILNGGHLSMAGGVFITAGGRYWVEVFSYVSYNGPVHDSVGSMAVNPLVILQSDGEQGHYDDTLELAAGSYILAHGASQGQILQGSWSSADPQVASVDAQGKVTGVSAGTTIVTANFGQVVKRIKVIVSGVSPPISDAVYTPVYLPMYEPAATEGIVPSAIPPSSETPSPSPSPSAPPTGTERVESVTAKETLSLDRPSGGDASSETGAGEMARNSEPSSRESQRRSVSSTKPDERSMGGKSWRETGLWHSLMIVLNLGGMAISASIFCLSLLRNLGRR